MSGWHLDSKLIRWGIAGIGVWHWTAGGGDHCGPLARRRGSQSGGSRDSRRCDLSAFGDMHSGWVFQEVIDQLARFLITIPCHDQSHRGTPTAPAGT